MNAHTRLTGSGRKRLALVVASAARYSPILSRLDLFDLMPIAIKDHVKNLGA